MFDERKVDVLDLSESRRRGEGEISIDEIRVLKFGIGLGKGYQYY